MIPNRATNLTMTEAEAIAKCNALGVGISVVEPLASGGVRLVCTTMAGAETLREKCKKQVIRTTVTRTAFWEGRRLS